MLNFLRVIQQEVSYPIYYNENDYIVLKIDPLNTEEYIFIEDNSEIEILPESNPNIEEHPIEKNYSFTFYLLTSKDCINNETLLIDYSYNRYGYKEKKWYEIEFYSYENDEKLIYPLQIRFIDMKKEMENYERYSYLKEFPQKLCIVSKNMKFIIHKFDLVILKTNSVKSDYSDILFVNDKNIEQLEKINVKIITSKPKLQTENEIDTDISHLIEDKVSKSECDIIFSNQEITNLNKKAFQIQFSFKHMSIRSSIEKAKELMKSKIKIDNISYIDKRNRNYELIKFSFL